MELTVLREADAKDWEYKGEGAGNLVLSYTGSNSFLAGKVLRIKKVQKCEVRVANGGPVLSKSEQLLWRDIDEITKATSKELVGQVYVKRVMSRLLDPKHVDVGIRINVCKEFLETVRDNCHNIRPAWRIKAADVDVHSDSTIILFDHSVFVNDKSVIPYGPNEVMSFSVEIKPKCGFLPSSEFIVEKNIIKKSVTRFKMHQQLKLHEKEITKISEYDPLDLFSGSEERTNRALTALFNAPGNNFRIFSNGSLIYGGLGCSLEKDSTHFHDSNEKINALLRTNGLLLGNFIELISGALLKCRVLDKLLAVQKLDHLDIEGAIHLYYNILSEPCGVCKNITDEALLQKYSLLHSFSLEVSLRSVREYLIAATAKDCSLMICFRHSGDERQSTTEHDSIFLKSCNQMFYYKANFIDLDMKSLGKMVWYYKLDQKIVNYYKKCCDAE